MSWVWKQGQGLWLLKSGSLSFCNGVQPWPLYRIWIFIRSDQAESNGNVMSPESLSFFDHYQPQCNKVQCNGMLIHDYATQGLWSASYVVHSYKLSVECWLDNVDTIHTTCTWGHRGIFTLLLCFGGDSDEAWNQNEFTLLAGLLTESFLEKLESCRQSIFGFRTSRKRWCLCSHLSALTDHWPLPVPLEPGVWQT